MKALSGLVSVVTPTRNAGHVIERAIRSVAGQTVGVREHFIIDDGSDDNTAILVCALQAEFPHIRYIRQTWRGAAIARNLGIESANGRYIAFLDSDDYWHPRKLECQIDFMEKTGAAFTYGDYQVRDYASNRIIRTCRPPDRLGYYDLLNRCPIGCLTVAYNQAQIGKAYMPLVKRGQDWGLWLSLTRRGVPAVKYPGMEAVYMPGPWSLSSNKLLKSFDMYRIFREHERKSRVSSMIHLSRHAIPHRWST